jgi:hypothetical protein
MCAKDQADLPSTAVLPHIAFNDSQFPWISEVEQFNPGDSMRTPWLALLAFTEAELTLSLSQSQALRARVSSTDLQQNPGSKAF